MAWQDGSDKSTGDVITAAIWNSYLGAGDGIDAMETAKVTTAGLSAACLGGACFEVAKRFM